MQRNKLKNIINKSKDLQQQQVGEPYDLFVNSLPSELDYYKDGGKYRLKAAWKAYGQPKNYQEALYQGLIETIGGTPKMPSIGYNEETDSYEYLNVGKENDIVAKDIRVWDNDVIPLVKELKLGGYIRTFNEEQNCWMYAKGGKARKYRTYMDFMNYLYQTGRGKNNDYDYKKFYDDDNAYFEWEDWEEKNPGEAHMSGDYKLPNHMTYSDDGYGWTGSDITGWTFTVSPRQQKEHSYNDYINYWNQYEPYSRLIYGNNSYYVNKKENGGTLEAFKNGGQMNVIPEGALHARKNNMELAEGGEVTSKGIPVVDNEGNQQAEIERDELILNLSTTQKIEKYLELYNKEESQSKKDEIAIKCGRILAKSIIEDTDDRTGLIEKIAENGN